MAKAQTREPTAKDTRVTTRRNAKDQQMRTQRRELPKDPLQRDDDVQRFLTTESLTEESIDKMELTVSWCQVCRAQHEDDPLNCAQDSIVTENTQMKEPCLHNRNHNWTTFAR